MGAPRAKAIFLFGGIVYFGSGLFQCKLYAEVLSGAGLAAAQ